MRVRIGGCAVRFLALAASPSLAVVAMAMCTRVVVAIAPPMAPPIAILRVPMASLAA